MLKSDIQNRLLILDMLALFNDKKRIDERRYKKKKD